MLNSGNSSPRPLDVLIVGGGLCGLATAISVTLAGHIAIVFEAFDKPHPVGGGLQSSPNGTRLLSRWGLDDILKPVATAPKLMQVHGLDGKLLARQEEFDDKISCLYGFPLWSFHRIDLQASLLRRAYELGVSVHFSSRITEVNINEPSIELGNGDRHTGDLVVVADGIWSTLRSKVLGSAFHPQPTGNVAYRITVDQASIQGDDLLELMNLPQTRIWVGKDLYAVGHSVRGCKQFSLLLLLPGNLVHEDSSMAAITKVTKKCDPILTAMLKAAQRVNKWREVLGELIFHDRLFLWPSWSDSEIYTVPSLPANSLYQGVCIFAGDMCHFMRPILAQNFDLGLEDAATLGSVLSHVKSPKQLTKAIALYNHLTTCRSKRVLEETEVYEQKLRFANADTKLCRDNGALQSLHHENDWILPKTYDWIWEYDAYEEAEKAYLSEPY